MILGLISLLIIILFFTITIFFSKRRIFFVVFLILGFGLLGIFSRTPQFWVILNNTVLDTNVIEPILFPDKIDLGKTNDSISVDFISEHYGIYKLILYTDEDLEKVNSIFDGEISVTLYHDKDILLQKKYKRIKFGYYYVDSRKVMLVRLDNFDYPYKGQKEKLRLDISIIRQRKENSLNGYLMAELRYISL